VYPLIHRNIPGVDLFDAPQNVNKVNTKATVRCQIDAKWIPPWARAELRKSVSGFFSIGSASSSRSLRHHVSSRTSSRQLIHSSSHRLPTDHKLRTWKIVCARFVHVPYSTRKVLIIVIQLHQCVLSASSVAIKNEPSAEQVKKVQDLQRVEKARRRVEKDKRSHLKKSRKAGSGGSAWD
jgi:peptidyl-tRNA hydrolase ICT1